MKMYGIFIGLIAVLIFLAIMFGPNAWRLYKVTHLFDKNSISYNFINMKEFFPTSTPIKASEDPYIFKKRDDFIMPDSYEFEGEEKQIIESIDYFNTDGLMILKDGEVHYENYWNENKETSRHIIWSVSKSFLSALVGIALNEGLIEDINDPVIKYLKDFKGTGYEGVSIKNLLQMSSGIEFNEDYGDPDSDINRYGRVTATGTSQREFAKTLKNSREPGTYNHYISLDSQMLGMLVAEVSNMSVKEYLHEKIWSKIGMQDDAFYLTDKQEVEMSLGGLNVTLRDMAKFGQLYLNNGKWNGNQIVPSEWVANSTIPLDKHVQPNAGGEFSSDAWGYGYQWWVPGPEVSDYTAHGIYNQFIYINPQSNVVIAKTSSNYNFVDERQYTKDAHIAIFRTIAESFSK
jgi:CubicO group peptidase (beta-lactamase class C family)